MPYDEYGRAVDRRRSRRDIVRDRMRGVAVVLLALVVSAVMLLTVSRCEMHADLTRRHDSMCVTYTYDGQPVRWYVMVDPDTQIEYVFNDLGGVCRRDKVVTPVVVN